MVFSSSFRTSLRLEPDLNNESKNRKMICFSSHYDIRSLQQSTQQQHSSISKSHNQSSLELNKLDVKDNENVFNHSFNIGSRSSTRSSSSDTGFKPGHRKTYSLGTSQFYSSSNPGTPISSRTAITKVMPSSSAATTPTASSTNHHCLENRINLIDDSLIIEENHHSPSHLHQQQYSNNSSLKRDKKPALEMFRKISSGIFNSNGIHTVPDDYNLLNDLKKYDSIRKMNHFNDSTTLISDDTIIHQGSCERKTILKEKKKPSVNFFDPYEKIALYCIVFDSSLFGPPIKYV